MPTLLATVGPPGCGKSYYVDRITTPYSLICLDDIRLALGSVYDARTEPFVHATANTMLRALMIRKKDIILDATNVYLPILKRNRELCDEYGYFFQGVIFNTDYDTCYERRVKKGFPEDAFNRLWAEYDKFMLDRVNVHIFHSYEVI